MIRGEYKYIWQAESWPSFRWKETDLIDLLSAVRFEQGRLLGRMDALGFELEASAELITLTEEALDTTAIEGDALARAEVRSSVARRLGVESAGMISSSRRVDGLVSVLFDATRNHASALTPVRLQGWRTLLFGEDAPVVAGAWRSDTTGPMQVVSGPMGRETVHFEAPPSSRLEDEMELFLAWLEAPPSTDPLLKAGIAHLWFVTLHPFDDGNGRLARAITDMLLARSEQSSRRFYSTSDQILRTRQDYYRHLEWTQKGDLDVTEWLRWFLETLRAAIHHSEEVFSGIVRRDRFWSGVARESLNERQVKVLSRMLEDDFAGFMTSTKWARMTKTSQDTAGRDIKDMIERGILTRNEGGGRSTSYRVR